MKIFHYEEEYIFIKSDEEKILSIMRIRNLTIEEAVNVWMQTLDRDESYRASRVYGGIVNYLTRKYEIF